MRKSPAEQAASARAALRSADALMGPDFSASTLAVPPPPRVVGYDYSRQSQPLADEMRQAATRIKAMTGQIGRDLIEIKEKLAHGDFTAWTRAELGMSMRTVEYHMAEAMFVDENAQCAHLPGPTVRALVRAPKEMRDELMSQAMAGNLTPAAVRAAVAHAKTEVQAAPAVEFDDAPSDGCRAEAAALVERIGLLAVRDVVETFDTGGVGLLAELRRLVASRAAEHAQH